MTQKSKPTSKSANGHTELLDEIERVLFKARAAKRPFVEYLLHMAFLEELESTARDKTARNGAPKPSRR